MVIFNQLVYMLLKLLNNSICMIWCACQLEVSQLDYILTDIEQYKAASVLAPIANSDHYCALVSSLTKCPVKYDIVERRLFSPIAKSEILLSIAQQTRDNVLQAKTASQKIEELHTRLKTHLSYKKVNDRIDRPAWITQLIKIVRAPNRAFKTGWKSWKALKSLVQYHIRK